MKNKIKDQPPKVVEPTAIVSTLDITAPQMVEIRIREDGRVCWININGVCMFRCCRIERLTVVDDREHKN